MSTRRGEAGGIDMQGAHLAKGDSFESNALEEISGHFLGHRPGNCLLNLKWNFSLAKIDKLIN